MMFLLLLILRQLNHLLHRDQGTNLADLNAKTNSSESVSIHKLFHSLVAAISTAVIKPHNSAANAEETSSLEAKPQMKSALQFLKIPPHAEALEE
jgi:hypothetical protein